MTRLCLLPLLQRTALQFQVPVGVCDSHAHVFGPFARHPPADDRSDTPAEFDGASFIAHLDQLGLTRGVPDDGVLMNLLARWLPDPAQRQRVLVDNPARLYDFTRS